MALRISTLLLSLSLVSCAPTIHGLSRCAEGESGAAPHQSPTPISAMPPGAKAFGSVELTCQRGAPEGSFSDLPLSALLCSSERLRDLMRLEAKQRGADWLVRSACFQQPLTNSVRVFCSATLAFGGVDPARLAAESSAPSTDGIELPVTVTWRPVPGARVRPLARLEAWEVALLPPAEPSLGQLSLCAPAGVTQAELRRAMIRAAAALGASSVVSPRCDAIDAHLRCFAELSAPELDPRTHPEAR